LKLSRFFAILKDGEWHNINELSDTLKTSSQKLTEFSEFLEEKKLIKYDRNTNRIKIENEWKPLLPTEEWDREIEKTKPEKTRDKQELTIKT